MHKILYSLSLVALFSACKSVNKTDASATAISYPATMRDTSAGDTYFGTKVPDPYRWLENDTSLATGDWVRVENKVTKDYFTKIPFREDLRARLNSLWNFEKYSSPFRVSKYIYFYKNTGLQNQSVLYRQADGQTEAELFLDPNTFSITGTTSLAGIDFTQDGALAAYQISEGGSDWRKVIVIDAVTKKQVGDTLRDVKFSGLSWKGHEGFYYSSYDKPKEGSQLSGKTQIHKLYYHKLNTPQSSDKLVFGGPAQPFRYVGGQVSENEHWLIITAGNSTYGNELMIQDISKPGAPSPQLWEMKRTMSIFSMPTRSIFISNQMLTHPMEKLWWRTSAHPELTIGKCLSPNNPNHFPRVRLPVIFSVPT